MIGRPLDTALRRSTIVAAILAALLLVVSEASAAPIQLKHAENGNARVQAFSSGGQEVTWGLQGDDSALFMISDAGVLSFKDSPDFEVRRDANGDNVYKVTIAVTASNGATQTLEVEVEVTDVDEVGKVTLSQLQPQVSRIIDATLDDPDARVREHEWQWSRGPNVDGPWSNIPGAVSGSRTPAAADIGNYLRVTVTYTDKFGSGKTASAVSENPVEAKPAANAAPTFPASAGVRAVDENKEDANVGRPVTASDADGDILLYTLVDLTGDFTIDPRTGQIKTNRLLDANPGLDRGDRTVTVDVIATDPSTASTRQTVVITVNDVNDRPVFPKPNMPAKTNLTVITIDENVTGAPLGNLSTYDATDDDSTDDVPTSPLTYAVTGADAKYFTIANNAVNRGELAIKASPNFEKKSLYSITVTAMDDDRAAAELKVTVTVRNVNDPGEAMLTQRIPEVGRAIAASLSDEDGGIRDMRWEWYRNASPSTGISDFVPVSPLGCKASPNSLCRIPDAISPSYTPTVDDKGRLAALVTYTDNFGSNHRVLAVTQGDVRASDPANTAPKFADDQDPNTAGNQPDAVRSVAENANGANVGRRVLASDADGDPLIYTLSDLDASSFTIVSGLTSNPAEGQIKTVVELDYEAKRQYRVVVTATDPSGASDSVHVIINVTDVAEAATIIQIGGVDENVAPEFADDSVERSVAENSQAGTAVGDPVAATDANAGDTISYALSGDDAGSFSIDANGQISVGEGTALDYESRTSYAVTVTATDGAGESDSIAVTINVTDVAEPATMITVPDIPSVSVARAGGAGTLAISWTAPSSDGGSVITEYDLRHIETAADESIDSNWTVVDNVWTTGGGTLRHTLTGLTGDTQYDIQMRAVNAVGDGPWSASASGTPTTAVDDQEIDVRVAAQRLSDGRTEFALQERNADGSWAERRLPRARFFPANARTGRWLASSPLVIEFSPDRMLAEDEAPMNIEVRIATQLLADGRMEFALQERNADGSWAERRLPRARFFPAGAQVGRWLSSSPLTVSPGTG